MNELVKQISILILTVSLNLVWVSNSFDDSVFIGNLFNITGESSDASDKSEYLHSFCCEDDVFMTDSKVNAEIFYLRNDMVPVFKVSTLNEYLNNVWQPPKFA